MSITNNEITQNSKSEPKKFSILCTFKQSETSRGSRSYGNNFKTVTTMTALQRQKRNIEKGKKQTGKPNGKLTEQPKLIEIQKDKVTA